MKYATDEAREAFKRSDVNEKLARAFSASDGEAFRQALREGMRILHPEEEEA